MKRILRAVVLCVILILLVASTVQAAVQYSCRLGVTNSGAALTAAPYYAVMNNATLATNGFISATGLDVDLLDGAAAVPWMLASDRTMFVGDIGATAFKTFTYNTGTTPATYTYIIPGYNGYITTSDLAALELGTNFSIVIVGYFKTTFATGMNILYKQNAIKIYIQSTGNIRAATLNTSDAEVVAVTTAIADGLHTVTVSGSGGGGNLSIVVDAGAPVTAAIGTGVPDSAYNYIWDQANVMPYITSITMTVSAVEKLKYQPNTIITSLGATATLIDNDSTQNGVITWGTNLAAVTVSVGSMTVVTAVVTPTVNVPSAPAIVNGITGGPGPTPAPVNSNFPLYGIFEMMGTLLNVPTAIMLNIGAIFAIVALGIMCLVARLGPLFTGIIEITVYIPLQIMHVADYWMVFMVITFIFLSWMLPRQTAVL